MDTPSNAVKKLNTVIVKFINNHLINDIIDCFDNFEIIEISILKKCYFYYF